MRQAMILAAGLGTRLRPLTDSMPKALVPVAGKPLLYHTIQRLKAAAFDRLVVNVHHFGEQIIDYLAANDNFGLDIRVSDERGLLLDTGGGIRKAAPLFNADSPVLIHNVDILSNLDLQAFYDAFATSGGNGAALVVSGRHQPRQLMFAPATKRLLGIQATPGGKVSGPLAEMVNGGTTVPPDVAVPLAFAGIHVLSPVLIPMLDEWPEKFSIISFYMKVCATHIIQGYEQPDFQFLDAGKLDSLTEAEEFIEG